MDVEGGGKVGRGLERSEGWQGFGKISVSLGGYWSDVEMVGEMSRGLDGTGRLWRSFWNNQLVLVQFC